MNQLNLPFYDIDNNKLKTVVQIPQRIVTKTVQISFITPAATVFSMSKQFQLGNEDLKPKRMIIKNVNLYDTMSSFSSSIQSYKIVLPGICDFAIFLPNDGGTTYTTGGIEYKFSTDSQIDSTQTCTISDASDINPQNGFANVNTIYVYLTFEFYY